jgi:hypothetical protein
VSDPTQPVPGPTREQIHGAVCEVIGKHHDRWDLSALITDAVLALLPARPSPTDDGEVRVNACQTNPQTPEDVAALDAIVAAVVERDLTQRAEKLAGRLVGDYQDADAETVRALRAEIERLRGSEAALRRAFDVAHEAGDQLWADRAEMEAEIERLRAHQEPTEEPT